MNLQPSSSPPFQESTASQELHVELVRHYADVLRMLTERIAPVSAVPAPEVSSAAEPDPVPEIHEAPPDPTSCWESAVAMLQNRDWHTETIVHLWLQPAYVQGLHVLIGVGVNLQGHRRIVNLTECGPQDQSRMEAVLDDLSVRGLGSAMLVTIPGNVALQAAVSCVWGTRAWVQRCLNTVMDEALSGLDPDQAMQFRHHLQQAWQICDAAQAQAALQQITKDLTKVNRSSGSVLERALESTLTLQHTGLLLRCDRGFRVLNSINTLLIRAGKCLPDGPVHQCGIRLCATLLELEPQLRRVRHSSYLSTLKAKFQSAPSNRTTNS